MIVAGIDPGLSGAVALLDAATGAVIDILDMPTYALSRGGKNKREMDPHALAGAIGRDRIAHAFIENVGTMPGQGVSSVFSFGKSYGVVDRRAGNAGRPHDLCCAPSVEGDRCRFRRQRTGGGGIELMPAAAAHWPLVKHDGRAEAALIATYGLRTLGGLSRAA